jgi:hypothetical protein
VLISFTKDELTWMLIHLSAVLNFLRFFVLFCRRWKAVGCLCVIILYIFGFLLSWGVTFFYVAVLKQLEMLTAEEQCTLNGFFSVFFLFNASQLQAFLNWTCEHL